MTFGKLPPCLCLHIQRITFEGGVPGKLGTKVHFGQRLDMAPFMYQAQKKAAAAAGIILEPPKKGGEGDRNGRQRPVSKK